MDWPLLPSPVLMLSSSEEGVPPSSEEDMSISFTQARLRVSGLPGLRRNSTLKIELTSEEVQGPGRTEKNDRKVTNAQGSIRIFGKRIQIEANEQPR